MKLKKEKKKKPGNSSQTLRFNLSKKVASLELVVRGLSKELTGLQERYNGLVKFNTELFMSLNALVENLVTDKVVSFESLAIHKSRVLDEIKNESSPDQVSESSVEKEP
jgi:hypothetical protein